ncbi:MAG: sigma 54-interacting transcriptional regulator [Thermodesulfobacteriota bacterium]
MGLASLSHDQNANYRELRDFLNTLELILDQAYLGLVFVDTDGIIRFMNKQYEELIGVDRDSAYGKHITAYFPDSRLPVVIQTGKAELGWKYHYPGGTTLVVNRIPIFRDEKMIGALTQCIFRDISELKDMARSLDLLREKVHTYKNQLSDLLKPKYTFRDILGVSEGLNHVKDMARKYAQTESPILITGETGTGKELLAHSIHNASSSHHGPFVCLNCASIPSELLESELFGYKAGAFTGANHKGKTGKIEMARGGTLFLDEIGELPLIAQAKLLRVLEEKRVEKVGAVIPEEVDFRLVVATNRDMDFLLDEGNFRQDLYFRLSALSLHIPPLRERREDILILSQHFLKQISTRPVEMTDRALRALMAYSWPGNVRELKNALDRAVCLAQHGNVIDLDELPAHITAAALNRLNNPDQAEDGAQHLNMKRKFSDDEVLLIKRALSYCRGNKSRAAKMLGISRSSLYNKMERYSLN